MTKGIACKHLARKDEMSILISNRVDFKTRSINTDKNGNFIGIKVRFVMNYNSLKCS